MRGIVRIEALRNVFFYAGIFAGGSLFAVTVVMLIFYAPVAIAALAISALAITVIVVGVMLVINERTQDMLRQTEDSIEIVKAFGDAGDIIDEINKKNRQSRRR